MGTGSHTGKLEFAPDLLAERTALRSFVGLLETEQQALINEKTEQLQALADSKIQLVHEINDLISKRKKNLAALGLNIETSNMEAWLKSNASDSLPVWRDIQNLAQRAHQLNHTSGELIKTKLRHNQQSLNALQKAAHNANGLYGPDGQPHLTTSGRSLGSG